MVEGSRVRDHHSSPHLLSSLENLSNDEDHFYHKEFEIITFGEFHNDPEELEEENTEMEYVFQPKYSFKLSDGSFAECKPTVARKVDRHAWTVESGRLQDYQSSPHLLSPSVKYLVKEGNKLFHKECERHTFGEFQKYTAKLEEENTEMKLFSQPKYTSRLLDGSFAKCLSTVPWNIDPHAWTSDNRVSSKGIFFWRTAFRLMEDLALMWRMTF